MQPIYNEHMWKWFWGQTEKTEASRAGVLLVLSGGGRRGRRVEGIWKEILTVIEHGIYTG